MNKVKKGFTAFNFNLYGSMYTGFGWFGWLQVMFQGKSIIVPAYGSPHGDHGDFDFKIDNTQLKRKFSQKEVDEVEIVAFKTKNERNLFNQ